MVYGNTVLQLYTSVLSSGILILQNQAVWVIGIFE